MIDVRLLFAHCGTADRVDSAATWPRCRGERPCLLLHILAPPARALALLDSGSNIAMQHFQNTWKKDQTRGHPGIRLSTAHLQPNAIRWNRKRVGDVSKHVRPLFGEIRWACNCDVRHSQTLQVDVCRHKLGSAAWLRGTGECFVPVRDLSSEFPRRHGVLWKNFFRCVQREVGRFDRGQDNPW